MADSNSEHLIRIIVQGLNRLGNIGDQVAKETQKMTGAQDKHTKSVKDNEKAIADLRTEHARVISEIKNGNKTYDDARFNLGRLAAEFDKLARKQKLGSDLAENLNRSALASRRLSEQLKTAHETERKLGEEESRRRVRQEEERQRLTQQTIEREVKEEERGVKARRGLMDELLDAVRQDHEERVRFNQELTRLDVEEDRRRTKSRVDEAHRAAQQVADISRRQDVSAAPRTIRQRISSFFGREDTGPKRFIQDLKDVGKATDDAGNKVSRLDRVIDKMHGTTNRAGFSIAKVDNNLRGLAVVGVIGFAQQLISALVALAGTLFAVASAAAQAGAAIGGALVASIGQAVPTIGLLIAAFGRIGAVFDAVKLSNKEATRSGRDQAAAADAQAAAADRVVSAQEQVVSATQRVQDATDALVEARRKALENIQDLNLAERAASAGGFQAETALRRAISGGDVGALEGLRIQRDQARLTSSRAMREAGEARSQGVEGSDQVKQAVQTLEEANTALGRANREMAAAQRAASRAADNTSAADDALKDALRQLSKAELGLYESVKRIQATFKRLFRPITDIIVTAFSGAVDRVRSVMGDKRIIGPLRDVAEAIAGSIRTVTRELTGNRSLDFFKFMATEAAKNIPLLISIGVKVNRIFSVIARAASPALRKFLEFLDELVTKGDKATDSRSGLTKLQRFFLRGEEMAESFAKLTGAVIGLFAALAGAGGADTGQSAIDQLTEQIKKATDWVNDNQDKVRQFFTDSLDASKAIASAIFSIGKAVAEVFNSDKVKEFTDSFKNVLLPSLTDTIIVVGGITDIFAKFLNLPVVGDVAQFALSVGLISKGFRIFGGILEKLVAGQFVKLLERLPLIGRAFRLLAIGVRAASVILSGPWGIAIAAVILAIVLLDRKFHFLGPTIKWIGGVFESVFKGIEKVLVFFTDKWLGMITMMLGGVSSLASAASHLPLVGNAFKGVADFIDKAREKVDGWRESLRGLVDENQRAANSLKDMKERVGSLKDRLSHLRHGSDEYKDTARSLRHHQLLLNIAMEDAKKRGQEGAKGPRTLGDAAKSAADVVNSANKSIVSGYNQIAEQLGGMKPLKYSIKEVLREPSSISKEPPVPGLRATGGWVGRSWGPQGPDEHLILAGNREAVVNEQQQGPVEEGLSLRSMLFGGPSSLADLFRQMGGAAFAQGGFVDKVRARAAHLASLRLPYRWGGGHGVGTIDDKEAAAGLDCSGAVGYALGIPARFSADYKSLGRPGDKGQVVVYSNPDHTFMKILGRFFGTSGFGHPQAGTGPAWFTVPPGVDYLRKFVARSLGSSDVGEDAGMTGIGDLKTPQIRGPEGILRNIAQRASSRLTRAANRRLGSSSSGGGQQLSDPSQLVSTGQIRNWIRAGLRVAGQKITNTAITTLLGRIIQESSGNPNAVNRSVRGDQPKGILQTKSGTFDRYKVRGHGDVFNPVDNIAAAVRYMLARYKHLVGRGPGGYATGGFVGGKGTSRPKAYQTPAVFNTSVRGIIAELRNAMDAIRSIQTRAPTFVRDFARSISQITDEKGLLDQATTAIQHVVDSMALKLQQATFSVRKSGLVVRRLTPEQANVAQVASLDQQRESLQSLRGVAAGSLRDVERRLAAVQRGGVSDQERKTYETLVAARRSLVAKIFDLDGAIADAIEARFNAQEQVLQDAIDSIDAKASRVTSRADLFDRVANLVEGAGASQAAFQIRGADLQARAGAMIQQRDALSGIARVAASQGNTALVGTLIGRIEDLNVSLLENAAAVRSNTVQARQAAIDAITGRGNFLGGVWSNLSSLLQSIGGRTGVLDTDRLKKLNQDAANLLQQTGDGLKQQLQTLFNVDLRGLSGTGLVDALRSIDFGPIESAPPELRAQFEGLINSIIENAGAVEQNTQSLQDLTQSVEQSFSTTAWQLFRQAIFNGSGGLLPRYQIPALASGGTVMSDGLVFAHSGEPILPARVSRNMPDWGSGDTTTINITTPTQVADPGYIADVLSFRKSLRRAT